MKKHPVSECFIRCLPCQVWLVKASNVPTSGLKANRLPLDSCCLHRHNYCCCAAKEVISAMPPALLYVSGTVSSLWNSGRSFCYAVQPPRIVILPSYWLCQACSQLHHISFSFGPQAWATNRNTQWCRVSMCKYQKKHRDVTDNQVTKCYKQSWEGQGRLRSDVCVSAICFIVSRNLGVSIPVTLGW